MAAACVARPVYDGRARTSHRPKTLSLRTHLAESRLECEEPWPTRTAGIYTVGGGTRYSMHTANPMNQNHSTTARPTPASRTALVHPDLARKASVLVAELLRELATSPLPYGTAPPSYEHDQTPPLYSEADILAHATVTTDSAAPSFGRPRQQTTHQRSDSNMDFKVDFGDTSGFQTRGKKKKKATAFDPWADDDEKKDEAGSGGDAGGGGDGTGGNSGGGAGGSGGGGDDNNGGGGDDDDDWGFGTSKKNKKKAAKKKQQEEEEKKAEEEEAVGNADPLSWADETNNANADDDWTLGFTSKKDKKKKKKGDDLPPAVPDAPPATSTFHDISLDDGAPKLDFGFDVLGDGKKDSSSSFGAWGKTWDFDSIGKSDKKAEKEKTADGLGDNNPWSLNSKTKKKSAFASFDFGDFSNSNNADLGLNGDDVTSSKGADDAWGFSASSKKDKKKKGVIEEIKEEPEPPKEEETSWGGWGMKTSKKKTTKADDALLDKKFDPPAEEAESAFDWGFGKKDKKKKDILSEVEEKSKPAEEPKDDGDDWMSNAWGSAAKKKTTKKTSGFDDLTSSLDFISKTDSKKASENATSDPLSTSLSSKKDKKTSKKGLIEEEPIPPPAPDPGAEDDIWATFGSAKKTKKGKVAEPEPEPEPIADPVEADTDTPMVAWDFGLTPVKKRRKEKEMRLDGTWDSRITQEMVDEAEAAKAAEPEPEPEPEVAEEKVAWDAGLSEKEKKKKQRQMIKDGVWDSRITQEQIDEEEAAKAEKAAEPEPEPVKEKKVAWDYGLSPVKKKRKEREMKLDGTWDDRITQEMVDAEEAEAAQPEPEPEPVKEERFPWDHGLTAIQKRKKEKQMKADGTWEDRLTQEKIDEEAAAAAAPDPEPEEDTWGAFSTWGTKDKKKKSGVTFDSKLDSKADDSLTGLSSKDKKKKASVEPEPEPAKKEEKLDDIWDFGLSSKDKKKKEKEKEKEKDSKKKSTSGTFDDIIIEEPAPEPPVDDIWGSWGKADKKAKKGKKVDEPPPPAPTPPKQGLTPEPQPADMPEVDDFGWAGLDSGKKSKKVAEDPPKKSSIWGFGSSASTLKTKKEKEAKAKKEAEEQAKQEEEARLKEEAEAAKLAEEAAAAKKTSKTSKLSKSSKTDEKKKGDDLLDLLDEPVPTSSSKLKKSSTKASDKTEDDKTNDYFGLWGTASTSKKTAGKKDTDNKKEIGKQGSTNGGGALDDLAKDIESPVDDKLGTSSSKLTKTMSNGKTKLGSSVADRIRALEGKKESTGKKSKVDEEPLTKDEPALEKTLSPKEEKKASKTKATVKSKKDAPLSPSAADEKKSKDSVPGSFPGAFGEEEDLLGADDLGKTDKSKSRKASKVEAKPTKSSKTTKTDSTLKNKSMDPAVDNFDLLDDPKLPTPPPEDKKSAKKERPRVERASTSSWGFWGATPPPKKATKNKTADDDSPTESKKEKSPPAALSRSKSTRTPKEKEKEDQKEAEKASKSSGSEKASSSKTKERPKASRGMSFSSFMLGSAPPSAMRSKPTRRSSVTESKSSSRRQSVDHGGLASPPPEKDDPVNDKAAKVLGTKSSKVGRKSSIKDKSKAYVDPYPIDDDDMVMINAADKAADGKKTKDKPKSKTSTKPVSTTRTTKPRSKTLSGDEDVVMVDATGGDAVLSGQDEADSPERGGAVKKATGFLSSFFGGAKTMVPVEVPVTDVEDGGLPIRTKSTRRRSKVPDGADTTDAPMETDADIEARRAERKAKRQAKEKAEEDERVAREQKRRERRDREKADLEARREKERDRARQERVVEDQRREDKRARRREREERAAQEEADIDAAAEKRREERRRLREKLEAEAGDKGQSKEERRRTYHFEEEDRRAKKDDRKSRTKDTSSRRKSSALMNEYHESRSGSGRGIKPPEDKTSSWIDSQKDEPPEVPPIEPTVLDESGQAPRPVDEADSRRRRKDKYGGMTEDEIAEYRARKRAQRRTTEKSASGGSDEKDARKSNRRSKMLDDEYYGSYHTKNTDSRPTLGRNDSKRNSFLGKFF